MLPRTLSQPWRSANWPSLGLAIAVILCVQAIYWLLLDPLLFSPKPAENRIGISAPMLAKLDRPDLEALERAQFEPVELPMSRCCDTGYFAFRATFELASVPPNGLGLGPKLDAENFLVAVNGHLIHNPGRMEAPGHTFHGLDKRPIRLPAAALNPGANRLDIVMVNTAVPYLDIRGVTLGEYKALIASGARRTFMVYDYRTLGGIVAGIVALLALIVMLRSQDRAMAFWLAVLAGAWCARSLYHDWYNWPFGASARVFFVFLVMNLLPLAWLNFIDCWTGKGMRWLRWGLTASFAVAMTVWGVLLLGDAPRWFDASQQFFDYWGRVVGGAAILRVVWHLATQKEERTWELALLLLCVVAVIRNWIDLGAMHVSNTAPILFLALAIAFLSRNVRLFRSMDEYNRQLATQLAEREAELAKSFDEREVLVRRQALVDERQRIMRDMHDGIGGQLMGLLLASRRKAIPRAELNQALQNIVDELRLIIDSMDSVGEKLGSALAMFRARIEPRLTAAGITLNWSNALPGDLDGLEAAKVIQIFRIVQEAVTNAIKHSGSDAIDIAISMPGEGHDRVAIRIADHGKGIPADPPAGRGLANMANRAAAVGADLDVSGSGKGTVVTLTVPLPKP